MEMLLIKYKLRAYFCHITYVAHMSSWGKYILISTSYVNSFQIDVINVKKESTIYTLQNKRMQCSSFLKSLFNGNFKWR